jgi:hypothetical protein
MCKHFFNASSEAAKAAQQDAAATKAEMDAKEAKRRTDIQTGQSSIDSAFAQFNDPYFANFKNAYMGTQNPEIERQYGVAKDKEIAGLAGRGVLDSTIGANDLGLLEQRRGDAQGNVANDAADAASNFKNQVEKTKSDLYSLNTAAADPNMIANRAQGESTALIPPQARSPLGNLFGDLLAPVAAYGNASAYAPGNRYSPLNYGAPTSGAGNSRIQ